MMQPTLANDLLDGAGAAAEYLGLQRRTIYRMAETGEIPAIRKGGKIFFRKSELDMAFRAMEPEDEDYQIPIARTKYEKAVERAKEPKVRPPGACTFKDMVPLLSELFDPSPTASTRLTACAKNLERVGLFPKRPDMRGKTLYYSPDELLDMLVAMALHHIGFPPVGAVALCKEFPERQAPELTLTVGEHFLSTVVLDVAGLRAAAARYFPDMVEAG